MPTAFFVTADANPASCRVIGWVLGPWGHQSILYKFIHCTPELNRGDFCVDGVDYNASGSTSLNDETITSKPYLHYTIKKMPVSTHYLILAVSQNT